MGITAKGKAWEISHSLWIIWTFSLSFLSWVAFFYIGARTRQIKWIAAGAVYSVPIVLAFAYADNETLWYGWLGTLTGFLAFGLGLISIFHAFFARREYLLRLEAIQSKKPGKQAHEDFELKERIREDYGIAGPATTLASRVPEMVVRPDVPPLVEPARTQREAIASTNATPPDGTDSSFLVDINNGAVDAIAGLPGVGPALAQWAVQMRDTKGGFQSLEDFGQSIGLDHSTLEVIRPLVVVRSLKAGQKP